MSHRSALHADRNYESTRLFSLLDSSLDSFGPCAEQRKRPDNTEDSVYEGNPIDVRFPSSGIGDVGIIWDTSIYLYRDTYYLKQVRRVALKIFFTSSHNSPTTNVVLEFLF